MSVHKKPAASPSIRRKVRFLEEMARRGTPHEALIAAEKLRKIQAKFDFSEVPVAYDEDDIFSSFQAVRRAGSMLEILKVAPDWIDASNLIRWILRDKLRIETAWFRNGADETLKAAIHKGDQKRLRTFVAGIHKKILALCRTYFGDSSTGTLDRAPFIEGLFDGMMDLRRKEGEISPGRSPNAPKKILKRQRIAAEKTDHRAATVHPYDLGWTLGKGIRLDLPAEELESTIHLALHGSDPPAG
jgi:hypothetical protein